MLTDLTDFTGCSTCRHYGWSAEMGPAIAGHHPSCPEVQSGAMGRAGGAGGHGGGAGGGGGVHAGGGGHTFHVAPSHAFHGPHGGGKPKPGRFPHRFFQRWYGGYWWDWGPYGWTIVTQAPCTWSPISPSPELYARAVAQLTESDGAPVIETWIDEQTYRYDLDDSGLVVVSVCTSVSGSLSQPPPHGMHCVCHGETSTAIASFYGVDPLDLLMVNAHKRWNQTLSGALDFLGLEAGELLWIPGAMGARGGHASSPRSVSHKGPSEAVSISTSQIPFQYAPGGTHEGVSVSASGIPIVYGHPQFHQAGATPQFQQAGGTRQFQQAGPTHQFPGGASHSTAAYEYMDSEAGGKGSQGAGAGAGRHGLVGQSSPALVWSEIAPDSGGDFSFTGGDRYAILASASENYTLAQIVQYVTSNKGWTVTYSWEQGTPTRNQYPIDQWLASLAADTTSNHRWVYGEGSPAETQTIGQDPPWPLTIYHIAHVLHAVPAPAGGQTLPSASSPGCPSIPSRVPAVIGGAVGGAALALVAKALL